MTTQYSSTREWLESISLGQYTSSFEANEIDLSQLSTLDHALLKEIGVNILGHRLKMLETIKSPDAEINQAHPFSEDTPDAAYRVISVVFVDLVDSTPLAESIDEEVFRQVILEYQETCSAALRTHGGFIARYFGDGILAYFGYPQATGEDASAAARASLLTLDNFTARKSYFNQLTPVELSIRVGIATGRTLVGDIVGIGASQQATALGRVPNLAARVQSAAATDQIMVCGDTATLLQGRFDFENTGQHRLKGIETPQTIFQLLGEHAASSRFERALSRGLNSFVGRKAELQRLFHQLLSENNKAGVALITGDAGIGKSRLVYECQCLLSQSQNCYVVGHCHQEAQRTPYHPFVEILQSYCSLTNGSVEVALADSVASALGGVAEHLPYLLQLIGQPQPTLRGLPPELTGAATERAVLHSITHIGSSPGVLLILEDIHWMDSASKSLLNRLTLLPLRLVATSRHYTSTNMFTSKQNLLELHLQPLSVTQTLKLVTDCSDDAISDQQRQHIVMQAEGNPLFAEEIARHAVRNNSSTVLPVSVDSLFQQQIDDLDSNLQRRLRCAAVLGRQFHRRTLALMSPDSYSVDEALANLLRKNLIVKESKADQFAFKHALIRDTVYSNMLREEKQLLHQSAAEAIEQIYSDNLNEVIEQLAEHYLQTDLTGKQIDYLIRSGDRALSLYSLDAAETRYNQALSALQRQAGEKRIDLIADTLLKLSRVYYFQYEFKNIVEQIEPFLEEHDTQLSAHVRSRLLSECGYANVFRGRCSTGVDQLNLALEMSDSHQDRATIGYAHIGLSWYYGHWHNAPTSEINRLFKHSFKLALKCGKQTDDLWLQSKAWMSAGCFYMAHSTFDKALKCSKRLCELANLHNDPRPKGMALYIQSTVEGLMENYDRARELAHEGIETSISPLDKVISRAALVYANMMLGEHEQAVADFRSLRDRLEATEFRVVSFYSVDAPYGLAQILAGSMNAGENHITRAATRYHQFGLNKALANGNFYKAKYYAMIALSNDRPSLSVMLKNASYLIRLIPRVRQRAIEQSQLAFSQLSEKGSIGLAAETAWLLHQLNSTSKRHNDTVDWQRIASELAELSGHTHLLEQTKVLASPGV